MLQAISLKQQPITLRNSATFFFSARRCCNGMMRLFSTGGKYPPHIVIKMPALSPTMTQGNLVSWKKKLGDEVVPGDVIAEVETDKAQIDFECQEEGFLARLLVSEGTKDIPISQPVAILAENESDIGKFADYDAAKGEDSSIAKQAADSKTAASESTKPSASSAGVETVSVNSQSSEGARIKASPLAKSLASKSGLDLSNVTGSGPGNRIVAADIFKHQKSSSTAAAAAAVSSGKKKESAPLSSVGAGLSSFKDIPLSNMRKVIAARLSESKQTIPHYSLTIEVKMDAVLALRQKFNEAAKEKYKLSVNDFIIKASALTLRQKPEVNSSWHNEFIRQYDNVDISVAVSTGTGLITPIVFDADDKGLIEISKNMRDLAAKARDGKLQPQEFQGGTFTISNLGMFGIKHFTAIINPPQACILAIGATETKVIQKSANEYTTAQVLNATLSCDHRIVDGALGAAWLSKFKQLLENPENMLL